MLLPGVYEIEVVRRLWKEHLISEGFIRSELEINKCCSEVETIDFLEKHCSHYVDEFSKLILHYSYLKDLKYSIADFNC